MIALLIKEEHFRNFYKTPIIIKNKKFSHQIAQGLQIDSIWQDDMSSEELKEKMESIEINDNVNSIFAVPYIDHTRGISFFVLSTACLNGKDVEICKREEFDAISIFRKGDVNDSEFEYLENLNTNPDFDLKDYKEFAKAVNNYYVNDKVEALRYIDILDASREPDYPDDLKAIFLKEGLQSEVMWVRCENLDENQQIEATLLNTPYQDFGVKEGDEVKVFPYEIKDGEWVVICDLNNR